MGLEKVAKVLKSSERPYHVLMMIDRETFFDSALSMLKSVLEGKTVVLYVTLNRTSSFVSEKMKKNKIKGERVFFVDCITELIGEDKKKKNTVFAASPQDLNAILNIVCDVIKKLPGKKKVLIFDSVSDLLIYNEPKDVKKFLKKLSDKLKKTESDAVFLSTHEKINSDMRKHLKKVTDAIEDLSK